MNQIPCPEHGINTIGSPRFAFLMQDEMGFVILVITKSSIILIMLN